MILEFLIIYQLSIACTYSYLSEISNEENASECLLSHCDTANNHTSLDYKDEKTYLKRSCFCDNECYKYGDCCLDKLMYRQAHNEYLFKSYRNFKCVLERKVCESNKASLFVYSVGDCPLNFSGNKMIKQKCEQSILIENVSFKTPNNGDVFLEWPFYSNFTNTTYNNIYCGICNGEKKEHLQPWNAAFRCEQSFNKQIKNSSADSKMDRIKANCTFVKWMSDYMKYRYCRRDLISICLKSSGDKEKDETDNIKCTKGEYNIRYTANNQTGKTILFRNKACAECSGYSMRELICDKKKVQPDISKYTCNIVDVTWSILFDFNFFTGDFTVGFNKAKNEVTTKKCEKNSFYDPFSKNCRALAYGKTNNFIGIDDCNSLKVYHSNEYSFLNDHYSKTNKTSNSVFLIYENVTLNVSYFKHLPYNDTLITCTTFNNQPKDDGEKFSNVHEILTKIGTTLSLIGLCVLLGIYISFSKLRNLHGLNLICLCISYITVYLIVISSILLIKYTDGKIVETNKLETIYDWLFYILAVLLNYAILSTFSWMSIISYDICHTFMSNSYKLSHKNKEKSNRLFIYHLVVGFGIIPVIPVVIAVLIDNFYKELTWAPHYGGIGKQVRIAWFSNRLGLLVFYIIPVAIMLIINIVFFVVTMIGILRIDASIEKINYSNDNRENNSNNILDDAKSNKKNVKRKQIKRSDTLIRKSLKTRSKLLLFLKLLIIMGLGWMLAFMASFTDQNWIFLIHTIANAFQGFFISITFIFNKKVLKLLKIDYKFYFDAVKPTHKKYETYRLNSLYFYKLFLVHAVIEF